MVAEAVIAVGGIAEARAAGSKGKRDCGTAGLCHCSSYGKGVKRHMWLKSQIEGTCLNFFRGGWGSTFWGSQLSRVRLMSLMCNTR